MLKRAWLGRSLALLALAAVVQADVLTVGPGGYASPQAAIDAANDADVILFAQGSYPGFTLNDKELFLAPSVAGSVVRFDASVLASLSSAKTVVLANLQFVTTSLSSALELQSCAGAVRIQGCEIRSGAALSALGLRVTASSNVVVSASILKGGAGAGGSGQAPWGPVGISGSGGDALRLLSSRIALHDTTAIGGDAGVAQSWIPCCITGRGGAGAACDGSFLFSNDTSFQGGRGGGLHLSPTLCNNSSFIQDMGRGGHGATLAGAGVSQAWFILPQLMPGGYGPSNCPFTSDEWPPARRFVWGPAGSSAGRMGGLTARLSNVASIVSGGGAAPASFSGAPGELVHVVLSLASDFVWSPGQAGVFGVSLATALPPQLVGQLGAAGAIAAPVTLPPLPAGAANLIWHVQSFFTDPFGNVRAGPSTCVAQLP